MQTIYANSLSETMMKDSDERCFLKGIEDMSKRLLRNNTATILNFLFT